MRLADFAHDTGLKDVNPVLREVWCHPSSVPVRVHIWGTGRPDRPLVFLNGIGSSLEMIAPFARQFKTRPFIAIEAPGAGKTPSTPVPLPPPMLARLVMQVTEELGLKRFSLMGLSLGGALAQQVAAQYRGHVEALILAGACSGITMLPADWSETNLWRSMNPIAAIADDLFSDLTHAHISGVAMADMPALMGQLASYAGWSSLPLLPLIEAPALVLAGSRDRIVPPNNALQLSAYIRNAEHRILPDAGHLFPITEPERTASRVERFLERHAAQPAKA